MRFSLVAVAAVLGSSQVLAQGGTSSDSSLVTRDVDGVFARDLTEEHAPVRLIARDPAWFTNLFKSGAKEAMQRGTRYTVDHGHDQRRNRPIQRQGPTAGERFRQQQQREAEQRRAEQARRERQHRELMARIREQQQQQGGNRWGGSSRRN